MAIKNEKQRVIEATKAGKIVDEATLRTFLMIEELKESDIPKITNLMEKIKGEKGDSVKGEKGDSPTVKELLKLIKPLIPEKGKDGKDGVSPVVDTDKMVSEAIRVVSRKLLPLIPKIEQIEEKLPILSESIRNSLELLEGDERLDATSINGLDAYLKKSEHLLLGGYGGMNLYVSGTKIGAVKTVNFTGVDVSYSKVNGLDTVTFAHDSEDFWDRAGTTVTLKNTGDLLDLTNDHIEVPDPEHDFDAVNFQTLQASISGDFQWYLSNSASADVGGYKLLAETNDVGASTITADGTADGQALDEWVTIAGEPGDITIAEGNLVAHVYAKVARANATDFQYQLRVKFYRRTAGGAETQLDNDAITLPVLNTTTTLYSVHADLVEPITLDVGDRIVVKISTIRTGSAPRVTAQVVTLNIGSTTPSHISLPVTLSILSKYLRLSGGTLTGLVTARDHGTASVDELINVCYGTSPTPPSASTTTEGALYIQYTA